MNKYVYQNSTNGEQCLQPKPRASNTTKFHYFYSTIQQQSISFKPYWSFRFLFIQPQSTIIVDQDEENKVK